MKIPSIKFNPLTKKTPPTPAKSLGAFIEGVAVFLRAKAKEILGKRQLKVEGRKETGIINVIEQVAQILRKEAHKVEKKATTRNKRNT